MMAIFYTVCNYKKKVKSNPKQPSCKKGGSHKNVIVKKDVKSKVVAKKRL